MDSATFQPRPPRSNQKPARRDPKWWERAVDTFIHSELLFLKLPVLFLNPFIKRRTDWADANEDDTPRPLLEPAAA